MGILLNTIASWFGNALKHHIYIHLNIGCTESFSTMDHFCRPAPVRGHKKRGREKSLPQIAPTYAI